MTNNPNIKKMAEKLSEMYIKCSKHYINSISGLSECKKVKEDLINFAIEVGDDFGEHNRNFSSSYVSFKIPELGTVRINKHR